MCEHRITVGFHRLPPVEPDLTVRLVLREPMYVGMHRAMRLQPSPRSPSVTWNASRWCCTQTHRWLAWRRS